MGKNAVFYLTNQSWYAALAVKSALSVKRQHPDMECFLFQVHPLVYPPNGSPFKQIISLESGDSGLWYLDQTQHIKLILETFHLLDYDKVLFLDCDTYVCGEISGLFDLLDIYDCAVVHAPRKHVKSQHEYIPDWFAEYNTGVLPMRVTPAMINFFEDMARDYIAYRDVYGNDDQAPFRQIAWNYYRQNRPFKILTLPTEYNFRFKFPCSAGKTVKILHAVSSNMEEVARIANESPEAIRAWDNGIKVE